jgi:hypothetical protein
MTHIERLLDLWQSGASASRIAGLLGVTRNVVIGHVQRARAKGDARAARRVESGPRQTKIKPQVAARKPQVVTVEGGAEPRLKEPTGWKEAQQSQIFSLGAEVALSAPLAPVPLMDCRPGCCRWPVGRDQRGHLFCDQPVEPGTRPQWCAEHRAIGFRERAA